MSIVNEYLSHLNLRGASVWDARRNLRPARAMQFPCIIGSRRFDSQSEYDEAMAEFLNSNWGWYQCHSSLIATTIPASRWRCDLNLRLNVRVSPHVKPLSKSLRPANAGSRLFLYFIKNEMINFTESNILIAVIGMVGLFGSFVVITTAFARNKAHRYW